MKMKYCQVCGMPMGDTDELYEIRDGFDYVFSLIMYKRLCFENCWRGL